MALTETSRAKQADRDAVIDALTVAFVEGQLTPAEHDKRVSAALRARRVGTLGRLLEDVQLPEGHRLVPLVAVATFAPVPKAPTPVTKATKPRARWVFDTPIPTWGRFWLAGCVVLIVLGIVYVAHEKSTEPEREFFSVAGTEEFVDAMDTELGTTEVIYLRAGDGTYLQLPSDSAPGRSQTYSYNARYGGFSVVDGMTGEADPGLVDLRDLDADALVDNIARARADLGMDEVSQVDVYVTQSYGATNFAQGLERRRPDSEVPAHVEIQVSNTFRDIAWLVTDLSGDTVLESHPFVPTGK